MSSRFSIWVLLLLSGIGLGALQAAGISEQQADAFSQKDGDREEAGNQGTKSSGRDRRDAPLSVSQN